MSNTLPATVATESASVALTWTTKNGQSRRADSATAQAFAPRAARLNAAQAADLAALKNGQFRPFLASVRAALTKAEQSALVATPDFSLNPTTKPAVVATLRAIDVAWVASAAAQAAKGKKPTAMRAALHATLAAWILDVDGARAGTDAGMPDSAAPATGTVSTPDTDPASITDVTAKGDLPALV